MGGRGASSDNNVKAIVINTGDGNAISYRKQKNGYISDINGDNTQKVNTSMKQIINRAKANGYTVETYNSKQLKDYDNKRKKEREKTDKEKNSWYRTRGASTMRKRGFVK